MTGDSLNNNKSHTMNKVAAPWGTIAKHTAGAIGNAALWDVMANDGIDTENFSGSRITNAIVNGGLGALAVAAGRSIPATATEAAKPGNLYHAGSLIALSPAKDAIIGLLPSIHKLPETLDTIESLPAALDTTQEKSFSDYLPTILGGIGVAGALGLGGTALYNHLTKENQPSVKLRMPRKSDPNHFIEVDMPMDSEEMTDAMRTNIGRGIKTEVRSSVSSYARKKDPITGKLIPYDQWKWKYEDKTDEELAEMKAAYMLKQQGGTVVTNAPKMEGEESPYESFEMKAASVDVYRNTGNLTKCATSNRNEADEVLGRIYNENPSYWPYGLSRAQLDTTYIVRDKLTKSAAGFVGWQEQVKDGQRIGSYAIGILPEFRNQGFAKEAVAKIIEEHSRHVDKVQAMIVRGNTKSERLADSLNVPYTHNF